MTKTVICGSTFALKVPSLPLLVLGSATLQKTVVDRRLRIEIDGGCRIFVRHFRGLKRGAQQRSAPREEETRE